MLEILTQLLVNALIAGSIYALASAGLALIYDGKGQQPITVEASPATLDLDIAATDDEHAFAAETGRQGAVGSLV